MIFISLGGWCGTKISLIQNNICNPSYPFDYVRSSIEGVIDCIENNFENYFPKKIEINYNYKYCTSFIGEFIGFYHEDLRDQDVIDSYNRKINRFNELLSQDVKVCFLRTICRDNYCDEVNYYKKLQNVIDNKYKNIKYIICFIIPNQNTTQYYTNLDDKTFVFTLNDLSYDNKKLGDEYKPIYDFIKENDLFTNIPESKNIDIINTSRLWLVYGYPMVNYMETQYNI